MSAFAAFLIFVLVTLAALVLTAPFILWRRRRDRKRAGRTEDGFDRSVTWLEVAPGLLSVALMAAALASEHVAPTSWLGQRVAASEGKFWLFLLLFIPSFLLERAYMPRLLAWRDRRRAWAGRASPPKP